jgi:hypothetical protein
MRYLPGTLKSTGKPEELLVSLVEVAHLLVSRLESLPEIPR